MVEANELIKFKIDTLPKIRLQVFNVDYKKIYIKDYFIEISFLKSRSCFVHIHHNKNLKQIFKNLAKKNDFQKLLKINSSLMHFSGIFF